MTLALLITAVGGAWAQVAWPSGDCTVTLNNGTLTVSGNGAMDEYANPSDRPWENNSGDITSVVVESGVTSVGLNAFNDCSSLTSITLPEGLTAIGDLAFNGCSSLQSITIPSTVTSIGGMAFYNCSAITSITLPEGLKAIDAMAFGSCSSLTSVTLPSTVTTIGDMAFFFCSAISDVNLYANPDNLTWGDTSMDFKESKATQCHVLAEHLSTYQNNFSSVNVTFVGDLQPLATSTIEVTTDAASEGATFTEATFAMPDFDATAEYELVRDMSYKVAFSGVPTRARLAKDGDGKFHFADGLTFQLLDNIDAANPKDITSAEGITFMVGEVEAVVFEGNTFYQLNKATLVPLADFLADAHLGNYAICAVASTGEYDGSFSSGMITLFQGYEVEVAAKEFITYYKDEPLYVEDEAAELYTIESVNGDQAVLSDRSDAMPSNTPMLVYNKSNETKVILLIPCAEPDMAITVAPEFQGTLTGTTIAASTEGQTNYAFNGKAFVFVKNAIEVGPNKAWLSVNTGVPSARITLVFDDETTGVESVELRTENGEFATAAWYDLNGRKLNGMPTKKGVYIMNGRKVVVK